MRFAIISALVVAAFAAPMAHAATPASGKLSPATPELTYTYGPNAISNQSGTAQQMCMEPTFPCDAYALTIDIPAGSPRYQVTVETSWTAPADDYDLYLLTSSGGDGGSSAGSTNPEMFTTPAVAGTYTVRVVPFLVSGSTATTRITLTQAMAPPPASGGDNGPVVVQPTGIAPRFRSNVSPADARQRRRRADDWLQPLVEARHVHRLHPGEPHHLQGKHSRAGPTH